jgi:hypothetical protein
VKAKITDQQLIKEWEITPSVTKIAKKFDMSQRNVNYRVTRLRSQGVNLNSPDPRSKYWGENGPPWGNFDGLDDHPGMIDLKVNDGVVMIGSDSHYWPGIISTAHRGFVHLAKKLQPVIVIKNGDEMDFPKLSRFAPIGWENRPNVVNEIEAAQARLTEIERAAPNAVRCWPVGNHDARFETKLAAIAPEYANVHGVHLKDHFPFWRPCWAVQLNDDTIVKHRYKGGVHATYNNTLHSGKTIITGHLHALKVTPHSDYKGTRFGVDCGSLADPYGPQFYNYTELNPLSWRSGFVVLTFKDGVLLWPEIAFVRSEGVLDFRGELISV